MTWNRIKGFFHNPVIKISYFIVIGLPFAIEIFKTFDILPPISGSIYELFYSGILILISFFIYLLTAPEEIKGYKDFHEYTDKFRPLLLQYNPEKKVNVVAVHLDETEKDLRYRIQDILKEWFAETDPAKKDSLRNRLNELVSPVYPGCVNRYLEKEYYKANRQKNKIALWICCLLNLAATILAILVFVHRIQIVIQQNITS